MMSSHSAQTLSQEPGGAAFSAHAQTGWVGRRFPLSSPAEFCREQRILLALGVRNDIIPRVDENTLFIYYRYLSTNLSLPLSAYFSKPTGLRDEAESRCAVMELIDPRTHCGNVVDGIFCATRHADCEADLPLIDLYLPEGSPGFQIVEDYWYWFWNWQ